MDMNVCNSHQMELNTPENSDLPIIQHSDNSEHPNMQFLEEAAQQFINDASKCKTLLEIDKLFVPSLSGGSTYSLDFEDDPHIKLFIKSLGLSNNVLKIFEQQNINFFQLIYLGTDEDLKALGIVQPLVREKILNSIKSFHLARFQKETLPHANHDNFTMADAVNIMTNVSLQLEFLLSATTFVRKNCSDNPVLLPRQDQRQFSSILELVADKALQQSQVFKLELKNLQNLSKKLQTKDAFNEADFLGPWLEADEKKPSNRRKIILHACAVLFLATATFTFAKQKNYF